MSPILKTLGGFCLGPVLCSQTWEVQIPDRWFSRVAAFPASRQLDSGFAPLQKSRAGRRGFLLPRRA